MYCITYTMNVEEGREGFLCSVMQHISRVDARESGAGRITAVIRVRNDEEQHMMQEVLNNLAYVQGISVGAG
jgi:hypothetical protein